MFSQLGSLFEDFIQNIANSSGEWTYTFIGLLIFVILVICLTKIIIRR